MRRQVERRSRKVDNEQKDKRKRKLRIVGGKRVRV